MADSQDGELEQAKRIMAALIRQPPKTHDEMKVGKKERRAVSKHARASLSGKQSDRQKDHKDHD